MYMFVVRFSHYLTVRIGDALFEARTINQSPTSLVNHRILNRDEIYDEGDGWVGTSEFYLLSLRTTICRRGIKFLQLTLRIMDFRITVSGSEINQPGEYTPYPYTMGLDGLKK